MRGNPFATAVKLYGERGGREGVCLELLAQMGSRAGRARIRGLRKKGVAAAGDKSREPRLAIIMRSGLPWIR
jgi:hypothetical protein